MKRLSCLPSDRSGIAMIELTLTLPVFLVLVLSGVDTTRFVLANLRCSQIAETVADNAGRLRHAMDEADVNEIMIGGKLIGQNLNFGTKGRIILSDLEQRTTNAGTGNKGTVTTLNPNGYRQWIRWQRCVGALAETSSYGGPIDKNGNAVTDLDSTVNSDHGAVQDVSKIDGMGPASGQIAASASAAVMVVEVYYKFDPLSIYVPFSASTLKIHVVQAFNIRQRTDLSVYNANGLSGAKRSDCRRFDASAPA